MVHHKKCIPSLFDEVRLGMKQFEVRLADFEVHPGDQLLLEEWDPDQNRYSGRTCLLDIGYVFKTKDMLAWKPADIERYGFQVMQVRVVDSEK